MGAFFFLGPEIEERSFRRCNVPSLLAIPGFSLERDEGRGEGEIDSRAAATAVHTHSACTERERERESSLFSLPPSVCVSIDQSSAGSEEKKEGRSRARIG